MLQLRKTSSQKGESLVPPKATNDSPNSKQSSHIITNNTNANANINLSNNPTSVNNNTNNALQAAATQFDDALLANPINLEWIYKPAIQQVIRICGLLSFISICANTPETFNKYAWVEYVTFASDVTTTIVFLIEMIAKVKIRGLFRGERAYLFDRWCQFDFIMVLFHIISIVIQVSVEFFRFF